MGLSITPRIFHAVPGFRAELSVFQPNTECVIARPAQCAGGPERGAKARRGHPNYSFFFFFAVSSSALGGLIVSLGRPSTCGALCGRAGAARSAVIRVKLSPTR